MRVLSDSEICSDNLDLNPGSTVVPETLGKLLNFSKLLCLVHRMCLINTGVTVIFSAAASTCQFGIKMVSSAHVTWVYMRFFFKVTASVISRVGQIIP